MGETRALARFMADTTADAIDEKTRHQAVLCIRDCLGVGLAAASIDVGERFVDYVETVAPGDTAAILGAGTASIEGAALANGFLCHALDWDDVTVNQYTHLTTQTLPAAMATAEQVGASGRDLLTAYLIGTQVHYRIAEGVTPSHYLHGWHTTGTIGTFGATAAAASVLNLSVNECEHALGFAASSSSALRKQFGSMAKPYHAALSAQAGVRAALLAEAGFTADGAILEGDLGYGTVMTPEKYDPIAITTGLTEGWDIHDVGFKPYPGETIAHGAEIALTHLLERTGLEAANVEEIVVTLDEMGNELFLHEQPETAFQSLYSIEFPLASILRTGEHGMAQFDDDFVSDSETQEAMRAVSRDFGFEEEEYDWASARVRVRTIDGNEYVEEEAYSPKQITEDVLALKFRDGARRVLQRDDVNRLDALVMNLADVDDVGKLGEVVRTG